MRFERDQINGEENGPVCDDTEVGEFGAKSEFGVDDEQQDWLSLVSYYASFQRFLYALEEEEEPHEDV